MTNELTCDIIRVQAKDDHYELTVEVIYMDNYHGIEFYQQLKADAPKGMFISEALLVIKLLESPELVQGDDALLTDEETYTNMLKLAASMKVSVPFESEEEFKKAYLEFRDMDLKQWNWELAILADMGETTIMSEGMFSLLIRDTKKEDESILVTDAEELVPYLSGLVEKDTSSHYALHTGNKSYLLAFKEMFKDRPNVRVFDFDIYSAGFTNEVFDRIIAAPENKKLDEVISGEGHGKLNFFGSDTETATLQSLLNYLTGNGEIDFLAGNGVTMSNAGDELRDYILGKYKLLEYDELEYNEGTIRRKRKAIIRIGNSNTTDKIKVRKYSMGLYPGNSDNGNCCSLTEENVISASDMGKFSGWSFRKMMSSTDKVLIGYRNSQIRKEELRKLAYISRGRRITERNEQGRYAILSVGNIGKYEIDYDDVGRTDGDEYRMRESVLQDGDIIMTARGRDTKVRCAVFQSHGSEYIASDSLIVIRPYKDKIDSVYLKIFFDSEVGEKIIGSLINDYNPTTIILGAMDLKHVRVPMLSMDKQREMAMRYENSYRRYKERIKEAEEEWNGSLKDLRDNLGKQL